MRRRLLFPIFLHLLLVPSPLTFSQGKHPGKLREWLSTSIPSQLSRWHRLLYLTHGDLNQTHASTELVKCPVTLLTTGWANSLCYFQHHLTCSLWDFAYMYSFYVFTSFFLVLKFFVALCLDLIYFLIVVSVAVRANVALPLCITIIVLF